MKLSVPIYRLKRQAKLAARKTGAPLHQALDRLARQEGFRSWSQLAAWHAEERPARRLLAELNHGDLVLLGARPEHGKTTLAFELVAEALGAGRQAACFTLHETAEDVEARLAAVGVDFGKWPHGLAYDTSDDICASYIAEKMKGARPGALIVVDYLQILDQQRWKPVISDQIAELRDFAKATGAVIVLISQIDRSFSRGELAFPGKGDVHLPNPLDLSMFSKTCFLNEGEVRIEAAA